MFYDPLKILLTTAGAFLTVVGSTASGPAMSGTGYWTTGNTTTATGLPACPGPVTTTTTTTTTTATVAACHGEVSSTMKCPAPSPGFNQTSGWAHPSQAVTGTGGCTNHCPLPGTCGEMTTTSELYPDQTTTTAATEEEHKEDGGGYPVTSQASKCIKVCRNSCDSHNGWAPHHFQNKTVGISACQPTSTTCFTTCTTSDHSFATSTIFARTTFSPSTTKEDTSPSADPETPDGTAAARRSFGAAESLCSLVAVFALMLFFA